LETRDLLIIKIKKLNKIQWIRFQKLPKWTIDLIKKLILRKNQQRNLMKLFKTNKKI